MKKAGRWWLVAGSSFSLMLAVACSRPAPEAAPQPQPPSGSPAPAPPPSRPAPGAGPAPQAPPPQRAAPPRDTGGPKERSVQPRLAYQVGLMNLVSSGMGLFRQAHPEFDGRGVLIAVLDGGVDPGIDGLKTTSTGQPKILDLRDFSGEGEVELTDAGGGRWTGELRELPFGGLPQADFNGNGRNRDTYRIEVQRDSLGWAARIDVDADGAMDDEAWFHDYLVRRETFTFASARAPRGRGPITAALNFSEENGRPKLVVYLDTSGHGAHVAGIAAGYNIYQVQGFHGVAPGAQIIGLKIADNARGSVSTTGAMIRAMEYAVRFAEERRMPLVINLSFGVGNANEGRATMDSLVNAFLLANPKVFFAIAAGNDGPGTSTTGLPGSAELAVSVGATYPSTFAAAQFNTPVEVLGWWSSRGGELNKPDVIAPGVAYSTVPAWNTGDEIKGGTSMATPYISGLAAVLISSIVREHPDYTAASILQALRVGARGLADAPWVDQGPGVAQVEPAWQWLRASTREVPRFRVTALTSAAAAPTGVMPAGGSRTGGPADVAATGAAGLPPAAYRRNGLASPGDTIQRFRVSLVPDPGITAQPRTYRLASSAPWLRPAQPTVTIDPATSSAVVEVRYDASAFTNPGRYSATVTAVPEADAAAGTAFVLANTIIVADGERVSVRRASLRSGRTARHYIRVPEGAPGLMVALTTPEAAMSGTLSLYEPTGRPSRAAKGGEDFGGEAASRRAMIAVSAEDAVPGVWEIVIQAMPGIGVTYDLEARVPPVRFGTGDVATRDGDSVTFSATGIDTTLVTTLMPLGADTAFTVTINQPVYRRPFTVPAWARAMVAEVEVAPGVWDQLTDFAISMYNAEGEQIGNGAMNYPFHRVAAKLAEDRPAGFVATLELFPAFALRQAPPLEARVRVRFEAVVPDTGAVADRRPEQSSLTPGYDVPAGWRRIYKVRAGSGPEDPFAATKLVAVP